MIYPLDKVIRSLDNWGHRCLTLISHDFHTNISYNQGNLKNSQYKFTSKSIVKRDLPLPGTLNYDFTFFLCVDSSNCYQIRPKNHQKKKKLSNKSKLSVRQGNFSKICFRTVGGKSGGGTSPLTKAKMCFYFSWCIRLFLTIFSLLGAQFQTSKLKVRLCSVHWMKYK